MRSCELQYALPEVETGDASYPRFESRANGRSGSAEIMEVLTLAVRSLHDCCGHSQLSSLSGRPFRPEVRYVLGEHSECQIREWPTQSRPRPCIYSSAVVAPVQSIG